MKSLVLGKNMGGPLTFFQKIGGTPNHQNFRRRPSGAINEITSVVGAPAKKLKKKVGIQRMASANILFIVSVS